MKRVTVTLLSFVFVLLSLGAGIVNAQTTIDFDTSPSAPPSTLTDNAGSSSATYAGFIWHEDLRATSNNVDESSGFFGGNSKTGNELGPENNDGFKTIELDGSGTFTLDSLRLFLGAGEDVTFQAWNNGVQQGSDTVFTGTTRIVRFGANFQNIDEVRVDFIDNDGNWTWRGGIDDMSVTLPAAPTVSTTAEASVTSSAAELGGNVTSDGGVTVTERGVVYSSSDTDPNIGDAGVTKDTNGSGTGSFSETISGLSSKTTYYFKAYAINSEGTSYGSVDNFTTLNNAPTTANNDLFGAQDDLIQVTTASLNFSDVDAGDALTQIEITALPTTGTLAVDANDNQTIDGGEALSANGTVSKADLDAGRLVWSPPASTTGYRVDSFTFNVSDGTDQSSDATMNLTLNANTMTASGSSGQNDWHLLANPFDSAPNDLLSNLWSQGIATGADITSGTANVYTFDESTASYSAVTDLTADPGTGKGLAVFVFADDDFSDSGSPIDGDWPKTLTVTGNATNGSVSIPVSNTDSGGSAGTDGDEGWNLIENPYGTPIEVDSLLNNLADVDASANMNVYLWDKTSGGSGAFVSRASGSGLKIAPFQSFFVRLMTSPTTGNLSLTDDDRASGSESLLKEEKNKIPQLLLSVTRSGSELSHEASLRFSESGELELDPYDAFSLTPLSDEFVQLSSVVGDQMLRHNHLPEALEGDTRIPMAFQAGISGIMEITWQRENLPDDRYFALIDHQTGSFIQLDEQESYSFNYNVSHEKASKSELIPAITSKADSESRFELIISEGEPVSAQGPGFSEVPKELELAQNYPNPFNPSTVIEYGVPERADVSLKIYNLMGREVATLVSQKMAPGRYSATFDASNLASGVYVYRLQAGGKVFTRKMVLIK